jgi:hypothetical protein
VDGAGETIGYLRSLDDRVARRWEATAAGVVITPEPSETSGWARYLALRLDDLTKSRRPGAVDEPAPAPAPPEPIRFGRGPAFGPRFAPDILIEPADAPDVRVRFRPRPPFLPELPR